MNKNVFGSRKRRQGKQPKNGWGTLPARKPNRHRVRMPNPFGIKLPPGVVGVG